MLSYVYNLWPNDHSQTLDIFLIHSYNRALPNVRWKLEKKKSAELVTMSLVGWGFLLLFSNAIFRITWKVQYKFFVTKIQYYLDGLLNIILLFLRLSGEFLKSFPEYLECLTYIFWFVKIIRRILQNILVFSITISNVQLSHLLKQITFKNRIRSGILRTI